MKDSTYSLKLSMICAMSLGCAVSLHAGSPQEDAVSPPSRSLNEQAEGGDPYVFVPETDGHWKRVEYYIERTPHSDYRQASEEAREAFRDLKYGIRIHWGVYAQRNLRASWDFVRGMNFEQKQAYQQLYKEFNPKDFDADKWMRMFKRNGLKMFAFTTKHHDGFSMYNTKTRVGQQAGRLLGLGGVGGPDGAGQKHPRQQQDGCPFRVAFHQKTLL